jgi:hypothetical protein
VHPVVLGIVIMISSLVQILPETYTAKKSPIFLNRIRKLVIFMKEDQCQFVVHTCQIHIIILYILTFSSKILHLVSFYQMFYSLYPAWLHHPNSIRWTAELLNIFLHNFLNIPILPLHIYKYSCQLFLDTLNQQWIAVKSSLHKTINVCFLASHKALEFAEIWYGRLPLKVFSICNFGSTDP